MWQHQSKHRAEGLFRRRRVIIALAVLCVAGIGAALWLAVIPRRGPSSARPESTHSVIGSPHASVASASPSPSPLPSRSLIVPPGDQTCFPFPARKANFTPDIKLEPGVTLAPKYLDEVKKLWQVQWPSAAATFAVPADLNDPGMLVRHIVIANGDVPGAPATYTMKANDIVDQVDGTGMWDLGLHMHEGAHGIVNPFKFNYTGAPKIYSEGVTDFIRFTARGEGGIDRDWTLVNKTDPSWFDEDNVWQGGYGASARFLLWLTQHFDTSGGEYKMVRELNALLVSGDRDWQTIFSRTFGWSYHELFQAYRANPKLNRHC